MSSANINLPILDVSKNNKLENNVLKLEPMHDNKTDIKKLIAEYAKIKIFQDADADELLIDENPFRRPTRNGDHSFINFSKTLPRDKMSSNSALAANRLLMNIYESDLIFLPHKNNQQSWSDFNLFYANNTKVLGERIRPTLEKNLFGFLDNEIEISGKWTASILQKYFEDFSRHAYQNREDSLISSILSSRNKEKNAAYYLIQLAPDFLTEASAMARNVLGNYGPMLSEIFTVLIDEYGYGSHQTKHSTLFENTLKSVGLKSDAHTYWQFYLATSMMLVNYFHYISRDHSKFFRYLGALFYTETSLIQTTKLQSLMLHEIFGKQVDVRYFDEHAHIDKHHNVMAYQRIIKPALERFGDAIVPEILRGFEEFKLLQEIADQDLMQQIKWADNIDHFKDHAKAIYEKIKSGELQCPLETFEEVLGERSTTHVHPDHRLLVIETGVMDFWPIYGEPIRFNPGDVLLVPKHRLHGSVIRSDNSTYHQPVIAPEVYSHYVNEG